MRKTWVHHIIRTGKEGQKQLLHGTQNELIPVKIDADPSEANNCMYIWEQCPITGSKSGIPVHSNHPDAVAYINNCYRL
jgi:hypothetical protein